MRNFCPVSQSDRTSASGAEDSKLYFKSGKTENFSSHPRFTLISGTLWISHGRSWDSFQKQGTRNIHHCDVIIRQYDWLPSIKLGCWNIPTYSGNLASKICIWGVVAFNQWGALGPLAPYLRCNLKAPEVAIRSTIEVNVDHNRRRKQPRTYIKSSNNKICKELRNSPMPGVFFHSHFSCQGIASYALISINHTNFVNSRLTNRVLLHADVSKSLTRPRLITFV